MSSVSTIFALASASGRAGVAVVRLSGPKALVALKRLGPKSTETPRLMQRVRLIDFADGTVLDEALAIYFPAPKSFTGEDVVELHLHGGRAVIAGVLSALGRLDGCRLAEPGEFTRRAFENGKIDLTEAEGLADLIDAETEAQRQLALRQLSGALHETAERWRGMLLNAQALMEAAIDFADEGDVSLSACRDAGELALKVRAEISATLSDGHRGEILRDGYRVVIAGPPNVGKSSLMNALARREAAIVSPEAGTTRDIVELHLNLGGRAVLIADTAGLRASDGVVEREGIRRGLERARTAELVLWVIDATNPDLNLPPELHRLSGAFEGHIIPVYNKCDLVEEIKFPPLAEVAVSAVSTVSGFGLAELEQRISDRVADRTCGGEMALITSARHRQHLQTADVALTHFITGAKAELELRAEDLRLAAQAIGQLVGRVDVEEILGAIFGRFCIGK